MGKRVLVAIAVSALLGGANGASARECWSPQYDCGPFAYHDMCSTPEFDWYNFGHCGICLLCQGGWGGCHPLCYPADDEGESVKTAYATILDAAAEGDRLSVLRLGDSAPGYVHFNRERWAIQVLDCEKRVVIASLPILGMAGNEYPPHAMSTWLISNNRQVGEWDEWFGFPPAV